MPIDSRPLLLDDRHDRRRRTTSTSSPPRSTRRASRSSSTTPSSGTASRRSRPRTRRRCRPPTSSCSCARRSAASRREHGLVASLAPKPWPENAGNGGHVHFSLWEGERNRFHDAADGLSRARARFLAGVLAHLPGLCGLTAPSFNSYHRIVPGLLGGRVHAAGATTTARRRCACASLFRGAEEASTNVELKAADASCNPYLALGGLIAAGLDGLERGLSRPSRSTSTRRRSTSTSAPAGILPLPATQAEALDALEADEVADGRARRRCSRTPTSPSAARSGRPTPRGTRHSSSRVTSRSTERGRARRPPRARDPARSAGARSTSSAGCSPRATTRASGRTSRPRSPTGARSASSRAHFGVRADRGGRLTRTGSARDPRDYAAVAAARDEHGGPARRRRLPAARRISATGTAGRARRLSRARR